MIRVGLLSDTHGYFDPRILDIFAECDELWHAGDFGSIEVSRHLTDFKPLRGVHGNVDDMPIRTIHPAHQRFEIEGMRVWMTHIGGYPGRYDRLVRDAIKSDPPDLFICGHSHILRVQRDKRLNLMHLNPGAAGNHGIHIEKTMLRLAIHEGRLTKCEVVELGQRGSQVGEPGVR